MASTNFTTHYSIPLPLGTDLTTPMDYNEAAEDIDTALFGAVTDAGNASEAASEAVNTANTASEAVDAIGADLAIEKAKIVQLQTRMTAAENNIDDVYTDVSDMITAYKEPSATSTHAYAIGDYFIYNETLYKATAAIAIGATIVPNTNCETTNVSSELNNLIKISNLTFNTQISGTNYMSRLAKVGNLVIVQAEFNLQSVSSPDDIIYRLPANGEFTPTSMREIICMSENNITQMRVNTDGTLTLHASQQVDEYALWGIYAIRG